MRVALLADIHGNSLALDAVLKEMESEGIDEYWILGDIVALGPDPVGVLQRLSVLPHCTFIRGNTDRYTLTGDRPPPYAGNLGSDPEAIRIFAEIAGTFAWTLGAVTATGWLDWLYQLPLEVKKTLPDGTSCLLVHASPGTDDGTGFHTGMTDADIELLIDGCSTDLICVGHTHQQIDRNVGTWHIVNPGSISNPRAPVLQAGYAILDATREGYKVEHRLVDYDREQVISQVQGLNHPGADFIIKHLRGLRS